MKQLNRITHDPAVMGGTPCIRGMRVTVGTIVGLIASGHSREKILQLYPYLEDADITEALSYAAWRSGRSRIASPARVRVLVDMNLSPDWVPVLMDAGFDAIHWSRVGEAPATDAVIMEWARPRD